MKAFASLLVAGAALLLSAAVMPARATDDSVKADFKKIYEGVYSLYAKAEAGDPRAAFYVASLHLNGILLPFDPAKGLAFLETAAAKGDADGLYYLGLHHHHGMYDYKVDKAKGAELIAKAAQAGNEAAKHAQAILAATKK